MSLNPAVAQMATYPFVRLGEARAADPQSQAAPAEPVLAADER